MWRILFILFIIPSALCAQIQIEEILVPKWAKIDTTELQMKTCDFEPDAEAVKLVDWAELSYEYASYPSFFSSYKLRMERRIRIKILKTEGLSKANIKIAYFSKHDFQNIDRLRAYTYNLNDNGKIVETKVENRNIYDIQLSANISQKTFTFPDVKVGSVLEYRYHLTTSLARKITPWLFQDEIPTKLSQYNLIIPSHLPFTPKFTTNFTVFQFEKLVKEGVTGEDNKYQYSMVNVPSLKDEPYMSSPFDWLQRVEFSFDPSKIIVGAINNKNKKKGKTEWADVNVSLLLSRSFGGQLGAKLEGCDSIIDSTKRLATTAQKVKYIYNYVRDNWNWNELKSLYCYDVDTVWIDKKGDQAEINFVLLNLFSKAKIDAYPICTSSKVNGQININVVDPSQFDGLNVLVIVSTQIFLLDASQKNVPYNLIPPDVLNTKGFIIDEQISGWVNIVDDQKKDKNIISIQAKIDQNGKMSGEASIFSYDYAKIKRVSVYEKGYEDFKNFFLGSKLVNIDTFMLKKPKEEEKAFEQQIQFTKTVEKSADYFYFRLNMLTDLEKNPFLNDRRFSHIDFGIARSYVFIERFILDDCFSIEGLPENTFMIMPDTSIVFKRIIEQKENILGVRIELDFRRSMYTNEEYPEFREFYKKLFGFLNEQIVLKKKLIPNIENKIEIKETIVNPSKTNPKSNKKPSKQKKVMRNS